MMTPCSLRISQSYKSSSIDFGYDLVVDVFHNCTHLGLNTYPVIKHLSLIPSVCLGIVLIMESLFPTEAV